MSVNHVIAAIMIVLVVIPAILIIIERYGFKLTNKLNEKGADEMTIKMTLPNGSVIEGTAGELAELNEIINGEEQAKEETFSKPAQIGDIIRITDAFGTRGRYENGDVLKVERVLPHGVISRASNTPVSIVSGEYEIIDRCQSKPDTYKPSKGDIVAITGNTCGSRNEVGKVEDVGRIGAVVNVPGDQIGVEATGKYTHFNEMRLATDEEKAKYYRDFAFIKAGREVGEIKKGDVVEGERRIGTGTSIGIVKDLDYVEGVFGIIPRKDAYHSVENVTLIAPVESRVDNHEEDSDTHA